MPSSEELRTMLTKVHDWIANAVFDDETSYEEVVNLDNDILALLAHPAPTAADTPTYSNPDEETQMRLAEEQQMYADTAADTSGLVERLKRLCHPMAEAMPERERLTAFVHAGTEAASALAAYQASYRDLQKVAQEGGVADGNRISALEAKVAALTADTGLVERAVLWVDEKGVALVKEGDGPAIKALFDAMDAPFVGKKVLPFVPASAPAAAREQIADLERALDTWEKAAAATDIVEYLNDALKRMGTVGPRGIREMVAQHVKLQASLSSAHETIRAENAAIAEYLRYCASNYSQGSDGRNTFVMAAEWVEARAALTPLPEGGQ